MKCLACETPIFSGVLCTSHDTQRPDNCWESFHKWATRRGLPLDFAAWDPARFAADRAALTHAEMMVALDQWIQGRNVEMLKERRTR